MATVRFCQDNSLNRLQISHGWTVADYEDDGDLDLIATSASGRWQLVESRVAGDSNNDGVFDSSDLVLALQAGGYEDGVYRNSSYDTGDWNGDGEFDSRDIVFVFQAGTFASGAHAALPLNMLLSPPRQFAPNRLLPVQASPLSLSGDSLINDFKSLGTPLCR